MNILLGMMRAILIATGITPPTPENERKILAVLVAIILGLVVATWLAFKYLVPMMG